MRLQAQRAIAGNIVENKRPGRRYRPVPRAFSHAAGAQPSTISNSEFMNENQSTGQMSSSERTKLDTANEPVANSVETKDEGLRPARRIELSPETIKEAAHALFILWLKIAATLVAARLAVLIWPVFVLVILSVMLVATFNPLVTRLQQRIKRANAISLVVGAVSVATAALLAVIIPPLLRQARGLMIHMPQYLNQMEKTARQWGLKLNLHGSSLDLTHSAANLGPGLLQMVQSIFSGITGVLTVAVLTIYLLIDGQRVATSALGLLPRHHRLAVRQMFGEIGVQVGDYMRGQILTSVLAGVFSYSLLLIFHVPEPLALAFIMAVTDAIPLAGPLIGMVPALLMALTVGTPTAFIVLVAFVLYHQFESHILLPRIYGRTMKLSPSVVVISILIGATLMGIMGALLALPVAAAIPVVLRYIQEWREREDTEQSPEEQRALP